MDSTDGPMARGAHPDLLAASNLGSMLVFFDWPSAAEDRHQTPITAICIGERPAGACLYTGATDGSLKVWDPASQMVTFQVKCTTVTLHLAVSEDV